MLLAGVGLATFGTMLIAGLAALVATGATFRTPLGTALIGMISTTGLAFASRTVGFRSALAVWRIGSALIGARGSGFGIRTITFGTRAWLVGLGFCWTHGLGRWRWTGLRRFLGTHGAQAEATGGQEKGQDLGFHRFRDGTGFRGRGGLKGDYWNFTGRATDSIWGVSMMYSAPSRGSIQR